MRVACLAPGQKVTREDSPGNTFKKIQVSPAGVEFGSSFAPPDGGSGWKALSTLEALSTLLGGPLTEAGSAGFVENSPIFNS